ncbi:hypothetical protein LV82_02590 [Albidovulum inexpectatum]|uniref:Methyltransferase family protein n=2 Tax=Albidovulum inexpectatum TaxID=196587 RepID=A0A2S5JEH9_9RHOB|nr:hypothetical protein LV82_02590 [Albidovulum inexpectatum]
MQNVSHAVMAQRHEPKDSNDDFPTPPWATRALLHHVIGHVPFHQSTCLEPACGRGYMSRPLAEKFASVESSDLVDYGFGHTRDFLAYPYARGGYDWVITNPPFKLAMEFAERALEVARQGVAILARTVFLESITRYETLFLPRPPTYVAQFVERVPMVKGRVDPKASTATGYAWFVWDKTQNSAPTRLVWIPPCRSKLERPEDYIQASFRS